VRFILNIISFCALSLISCSNSGTLQKDADALDSAATSFKWIQGKYIYVHDQSGYYYEEWFKTDDNNYQGEGYFLTRDCVDTIFSMKMRLMHDKEKTTLFFDIKDKVKNKETEFTLTKGENNVYVFENPFRDFPSILQYKISGDTAIDIMQRGFVKNKEKVIEYRAKKIN
jgi:hypothetical protein